MSAASSGAIRERISATCASGRSSRNSRWCWSSSSSNTSASSSRSSSPTAWMISSPSWREAASTRSAICAGWSLASFGWGTRRRTVGTCPTNGSTPAQSRNSPVAMCAPSPFGSSRRKPPRGPVSTPTTRQEPATQRELDLVGAHQPRALDVDQLAVEQVALAAAPPRGGARTAQVELGLAHHDAVGADLRDAVGAQERCRARRRRRESR